MVLSQYNCRLIMHNVNTNEDVRITSSIILFPSNFILKIKKDYLELGSPYDKGCFSNVIPLACPLRWPSYIKVHPKPTFDIEI